MTLSVAIIGAGRMGRFHAGNLQRIDGVRIVAVADVQADQASSLAAEVGGDAWTGDGLETLARVRPDIVYICTSAHDHAEAMVAAAGFGINIFVEKPLTTTIADARRAVEAVERAGVLCTVGYQWRYNAATDAALAALAGLPVALLSAWWYWMIPPIPWFRDKRWGGGQIYDQTTHLTDLMRLVAGEATEVYAAYTRNAIPQETLPNWDASAVTLRFASGAVGSVQCTYALFPDIPENHGLDIAARERMARVRLGHATIFRRGQAPEEIVAPADSTIDHAFIPIVRANDQAAIRSTARDALQSLAITLAANYSAVTGKVIDVADFIAHPPTDAAIMPNERPPFTPETTDRSRV